MIEHGLTIGKSKAQLHSIYGPNLQPKKGPTLQPKNQMAMDKIAIAQVEY